jgi:opacity protein-like surface antigen
MAAMPAFAADQPLPNWLSPLSESVAPRPLSNVDMLTGSLTSPGQSLGEWRGFYIGGQFGFSDANADFTNSTQAPIAYSLRQSTLEQEFSPSTWPVLGTAHHGATGFGGFVGYNFEYLSPNANVVFGFEANYDQAMLSINAPNSPISRITPTDSGGNYYVVNITGSGSVHDLNFGTLRARAGWELGHFLPYMFAGFALGRADVNITETTSGQQCDSTPVCTPFSFTGTAGKNGEWLYGYTAGAGLDFELTHNVFLRGEYEFVQFTKIAATPVYLNTFRVGGGIKF